MKRHRLLPSWAAHCAAFVLAIAAGLLACAGDAQAQFTMVPSPLTSGPPRESPAEIEREYRIDAGRHLYAAYPMRVYRGKVPPLIYSVMVVETEIDATGQVLGITVVRKPAADEVAPWVQAMIRRAAPYPPPTKFPGRSVRFLETWLVDKSGLFQIDTLTEEQQ